VPKWKDIPIKIKLHHNHTILINLLQSCAILARLGCCNFNEEVVWRRHDFASTN